VAGIAVASAAEPKLDGADVVGNVGYGTVPSDDKGEPFAFMLGVDAGYTFRFGLRLGLTYTHGYGREGEYTRQGVGGIESVHTHHHSDTFAVPVGYDWLLAPVRLRASLDAGMIFFNTTNNAGDLPAWTLLLAPGFAALWQLGPLELGAGLKYHQFLGGHGFSGSLMAGGRFF
jgi:hypothetical protein